MWLLGLSFLSYSFMMLKGEMIVLPFGFFFLFSLVEFGSLNQLTALLALLGFILLLRTLRKPVTRTILLLHGLSFLLLVAPIVNRLMDVPVHLFNYAAFLGPLVSFVVLYLTALAIAFFILVKVDRTTHNEL